MNEMFEDLLNFGAKSLNTSGRLVFWIPVNREEYSVSKLPQHPELKLVENCEQILSTHISRRLIVMEKMSGQKLDSSCKRSETCARVGLVPASSSVFREQFFRGAAQIGKKERKERVKKYGHLNLKGEKNEDQPIS